MQPRAGIVKYGIIGAGMMGREHLLNIRALDGAEVVAIADPHLPSQEASLALAPGLHVSEVHHTFPAC
jgi:predicted homoserine dehydrogenase-like protein